ncbi:MMPL family transporter [Flindersiella endophytica]
MIRFGGLVARMHWWVLAIWLLVVGGFGVLAGGAADSLQGAGFDVAGSQSQQVTELLDEEFRGSTATSPVVMYQSGTRREAVEQTMRAVDGVVEVRSVTSEDRRTVATTVAMTGGQSAAQDAVPRLRSALADAGVEASITGFPAVQYDTYEQSQADLAKTELITFPVVAVFLLLFFGTAVAAAVPLLLGLAAVVTATGILALLGDQFAISVFALNIGSLVGLGLSIDFSLIMVRRFREEQAAGHDVADAVRATMATSGRSVLFSGLTLMLSMALTTVAFADLMIVRSITLGVVVVSAVGLLGGLTLVPALLYVLGDRVDRLRVLPRRRPSGSPGLAFWLSQSVTRRPVVYLLGAVVVLGALSLPLLGIRLVGANTEALPAGTESAVGAEQAEAVFDRNTLTPVKVTVESGDLGAEIGPVAALLEADPRVAHVAQPQVDDRGDTAVLTVLPKAGMYELDHQRLVTDLRTQLAGQPGYRVLVGGDAAAFVDFKQALYGRFPLLAAAITAAILLLLLVFFRSVLLPLKAAVTSALPLVATLGVLVWLFQDGHGERLLGFESQGRLNVVTPVIVFVILFALSTDYEVFLLSRVRENYVRERDTGRAVALGLRQTAGLITAAALILIATFGSLAASSVETLKEIGIGLAAGILLDATIVRLLIVPATMQLFRGGNWWLPSWLRRVLPQPGHEALSPENTGSSPEQQNAFAGRTT